MKDSNNKVRLNFTLSIYSYEFILTYSYRISMINIVPISVLCISTNSLIISIVTYSYTRCLRLKKKMYLRFKIHVRIQSSFLHNYCFRFMYDIFFMLLSSTHTFMYIYFFNLLITVYFHRDNFTQKYFTSIVRRFRFLLF